MEERDMMYGGYYQNMPGNMQYGNFGFQGMPGSLMYGNMGMPNMMGMNNNTDPFAEINSRLTSLENRVKLIEQKLGNTNSYQDDNSMYMI